MELRVRTAITAGTVLEARRDDDVCLWAPANVKASEANGDQRGFPEIDCLRLLLPAKVLGNAEARAAHLNIGADRVLIASGIIDEETCLRNLGAALSIKFESLRDVPRALCPLTDCRLIACDSNGLLPLVVNDLKILVLAPRETQARWLTRAIQENPSLAKHFRLTSYDQLSRFILRCADKTLSTNAINSLRQRWPELSAGPPRRLSHFIFTIFASALSLSTVGILIHSWILIIFEIILATFFLAWAGLRLVSALAAWQEKPVFPRETSDAELPVYSIIVALYDEAKSVEQLLSSFEQFDYPAEKLDIILTIEAKDHATREAIEAREVYIPIRVITCNDGGPRTKPKALNMALPFARGNYTVIYDAEDRPDRDQLRRALHAFNAGGDDLICVQARLCIDNTHDSWISQFFTAEYAGHFDVFLCGLAKMRLPLPLGGSSNHFRTHKLREIGAWDPYNVTEDADLGIRMARLGYRSEVIFSTTYEEAPAHYNAWLRQRTRWFKGWMQTWTVHMRHPLQLMRQLGFVGFLMFQLVVGGSVLCPLVHLLFILIISVVIPYDFVNGQPHDTVILVALYVTIFGYLPSIIVAWIGLARRNLTSIAPILLATPFHWIMLSHAAWRALFQFVFRPYAWEKTEHGLAKSSRRTNAMPRSLLRGTGSKLKTPEHEKIGHPLSENGSQHITMSAIVSPKSDVKNANIAR
jgi:glycosyltransferase XagB